MDHGGHRSEERQNMENIKILIVDDEQNVTRALARSLSFEEYSIVTADNGLDALEFIKENKIDLIISDQRMPQMTGVEFLSKAWELYPDAVRRRAMRISMWPCKRLTKPEFISLYRNRGMMAN